MSKTQQYWTAMLGAKSLKVRAMPGKKQKRNTWRGSDAQVAREVIFERVQNSHHVPLHLIQVDDAFHQGGINIHLRRLALCLGLGDGERENSEKNHI